jgi:hypothetical protein
VQSLFPALEWTQAAYSTSVGGELMALDLRDFREVDNQMAAFADTPQGKRKYLPYLMVNMLGRRLLERG